MTREPGAALVVAMLARPDVVSDHLYGDLVENSDDWAASASQTRSGPEGQK